MIKVLWMTPEYLARILAGRKTIEVRVGYSSRGQSKAALIARWCMASEKDSGHV
jgi:ASC-1-like (ASCH) protein